MEVFSCALLAGKVMSTGQASIKLKRTLPILDFGSGWFHSGSDGQVYSLFLAMICPRFEMSMRDTWPNNAPEPSPIDAVGPLSRAASPGSARLSFKR